MKMQIPDGVYPTMVTPFTENNRIDYGAVLRLIEWYDRQEVEGIFAVCQSSEIFFLSFGERLELLKFIVKNTPKHISVVASGHTAPDLPTQIREAEAFIAAGIDAYVFISNRFASETEGEETLLQNIHTVIDALPGTQFGIYECPYPYKRVMRPETLRELAETGRFAFLKDTCCDLELIRKKLKATEGTGLKIYNAVSATLLESLRMGCAGYSGVMANFHPELYGWLCKNFQKQPEKAQRLQDILGVFSVMESRVYPVCAKYYLNALGVSMGLHSRARSAAEFTPNLQMEFDQLLRLTERVKSEIL